MANVRSGNTWYVNVSSTNADATTYLGESNLVLIGIAGFVDATTDTVVIFDKAAASAAAGNKKFSIKKATAKDYFEVRLEQKPIRFTNGMWVTLTGSPELTFIFSQTGA